MQKSWRRDSDKLTFIICKPLKEPRCQNVSQADDSPERMLGDINLFLSVSDEDEDNATIVGEVELMIAEKSARRRGLGRASVIAFMKYVIEHEADIMKEFQGEKQSDIVNLGFLRVRVGQNNHQSLRLFEAVGFKRHSKEANVFGELELRTPTDLQGFLTRFLEAFRVGTYRELEYVHEVSRIDHTVSIPKHSE